MAVPVIAVLGAADPLGEAVLQIIADRELEVGELVPVDDAATDRCVRCGDRELPVRSMADLDFARVGILVCASRSPAVRRVAERAAAAGCRVVGFAESPPDTAIPAVTVPSAAALALQRALAPLLRHAGLTRLGVTVLVPAAMAGQAGIEELAGQTRALFAMEATEPEAFPVQIAFNLIPQVGAIQDSGDTPYEAGIAGQVRRLLQCPDLPMAVTAVWAPIFHGAAMVVQGACAGAVDATRLRAWLAAADGITLMDTPLPGGVPTPATDALDSDDIFVGRVRAGKEGEFSLWLVLDTVRLEAARIVEALEISIEK
jgi:aspartate-semialdehyde dehydrogenase